MTVSAVTPVAPANPATRVRWTHVAPTLLVVWIISLFDKSNMAIVINDGSFLQELGLTGEQAKLGWLSSGLFLTYAIAAPGWGWIVQRFGARITCGLSLVVWALTCIWSGLATDYTQLLISRVMLGVGEGAVYPVTLALVANWFPLKERGRATSFWWIGTMIGPMLVGLIVTSLIVAVGWRGQFYAIGLLALVLPLPMVWFLVRDRPDQHSGANAVEIEMATRGSLDNNSDAPGVALKARTSTWAYAPFWLTTVALGSNAIFFWGWSMWLPTYLRTARHFSFSTSGYLTFVIFGCAVITIFLIGHLSDRLFRRAPLAGLGWLLAGVLLIGAALAPTPGLSVVLMTAALCAQQVGIASGEMLMHSVVRESEMGKTQGVRAFITMLIGALSPALIGYIVQASGSFIGAFAVLAAAVIVSGGCMVTLARNGF
jgi:MFS transporter, ACS family, glucarate transporter